MPIDILLISVSTLLPTISIVPMLIPGYFGKIDDGIVFIFKKGFVMLLMA